LVGNFDAKRGRQLFDFKKAKQTNAALAASPVQTVTVSSEATAAHAKFLADMDLDLLYTLHSALAIGRDKMIFGL
jgi:hypothetical protein